MSKSILFTLGALLFIAFVTTVVIFLAKGYTFNTKQGKIQKTGILVVTSEPRDAAVYLDDTLRATTNTTINFLSPGTYTVRVTKDGFTPWQKKIEIKEELVTRLDLTLFPQVPDPRRLTFSGASNVHVTPDGQSLIYRVTEKTKQGLWVMNLSDSLPFLNNEPIQIYKEIGAIDLTTADILVAPDSKKILLIDRSRAVPAYYELDLGRVNDSPQPKALTDIETDLATWYDSLVTKEKTLTDRLTGSVNKVPSYENPRPDISQLLNSLDAMMTTADTTKATPSASPANRTLIKTASKTATKASNLPSQRDEVPSAEDYIVKISYLYQNSRWSPKQDKVIFNKEGKMALYDLTTGRYYDLPKADNYIWFPTDLHLTLINPDGKKGEIVIADYDGQNQVLVFSGQFVDSIAIPWVSGTRLVVLTNLNQAAGSEPNLYAINLR